MEEDIKPRVCRLCFNLIPNKNFFSIKGSLKDMLQAVTTELNLNLTSSPVMCIECSKVLQETFIFKTNVFENEERIEVKIPTMNQDKFGLRDVVDNFYKRPTRKSKEINPRMVRVCRTCLKVINKKKFIDPNTETSPILSSILSSCIPEMDLGLTNNPVICQKCYDTLEKMENFKSMCKVNESRIDAFTRIAGFDSFHKVNLHEVLNFSRNHLLHDRILKVDNRTDDVTTCPNQQSSDYQKIKIEDCLECVAVKMEPPDENETEKNRITLRKRNRLDRSQPSKLGAQKQPTRINGKCETKIVTYCSDCDFKTKYKYNLRRHLIIAHKRKDIEVNKKLYKCVHCPFATKWNIDLTRHSLSHVKPEALKCTRCPYSTNRNSQLIKHILSHVNADNIDKYKFLQLTKKTK